MPAGWLSIQRLCPEACACLGASHDARCTRDWPATKFFFADPHISRPPDFQSKNLFRIFRFIREYIWYIVILPHPVLLKDLCTVYTFYVQYVQSRSKISNSWAITLTNSHLCLPHRHWWVSEEFFCLLWWLSLYPKLIVYAAPQTGKTRKPKVSARQQCVYEDPCRRNLQQICNWWLIVTVAALLTVCELRDIFRCRGWKSPFSPTILWL